MFRFGSYAHPLSLLSGVLNHILTEGPCQPSMVYRYLRNLEGVSPPLSLTHLSCQTTAKAFTATRKPVYHAHLTHLKMSDFSNYL